MVWRVDVWRVVERPVAAGKLPASMGILPALEGGKSAPLPGCSGWVGELPVLGLVPDEEAGESPAAIGLLPFPEGGEESP